MRGWRKIGPPPSQVARVEKLSWQYYLWAATGAALLAVALLGGLAAMLWTWGKKEEGGADWFFLLAWAAGGLVFSVVLTPFQATRHFLPVLAPLTVLVLRLLGPRRRAVKIALIVVLVLQGAVAGLVALADSEYADAHRQFARDAGSRYAGKEVWFNGHWGWQHYAEHVQGFKHCWHYRDEGTTPPPGAILLEPDAVHRSRLPDALRKRLVLDDDATRAVAATFPARTMGRTYSSFYAVTEHRLPYIITFARTPIETCRVYRVAAEPSAPQGAGAPP
jgi:hypothetical protein